MTNKQFKSIDQVISEGNDVINQRIKGEFVNKHVYCNVNSLVEYCMSQGYEDSNSPVNIDYLENYYTFPEFYGSYAEFSGGTETDRQTEVDRLQDLFTEFEESENFEAADVVSREIAQLEKLESEPTEVYEWWAVSQYLYEQLRDKGHVVVNAGSCYIWGRGCSGQAILLDGVITHICAEMEILHGQKNEWSI